MAMADTAQHAQFPNTNSMRNARVARTFEALPRPGSIDWGMDLGCPRPVSFDRNGKAEFRWCYLGEISAGEGCSPPVFVRVVVHAKDQAGRTIPVAFHTERRGHGAIPGNPMKPGSTIVVMQAVQHVFADGLVGIRVEDPSKVMVRRPARNAVVGY